MATLKRASDIHAAVIGYGGSFDMGTWHFRLMRRAGMRPTAVVDPDPTRRAAARADHPGIETYASAAEMLRCSNVNLVAIVTPHHLHAPLALQCLRAGRHVVCEKPMALSTSHCNRMIAEARRRRCMLSTFHNRHWDGSILQAMKTVRRGDLGDIQRIHLHSGSYTAPQSWWRDSRSISGGILFDWGVHFTEYALQIIDAKIVEVSGFRKEGHWAPHSPWKKDANEDEVSAVVRFANGAWLELTATSIDADPPVEWCRITGTRGTYRFGGDTWELVRASGRGQAVRRGKNPPEQWHRYYQNVADHLVKKTPLIITAQWARRTIHILDLANRSAASGTALRAHDPHWKVDRS